MATKKATIIIDVDDKSLVELNQEIKNLEQSMQGLKVGTQQWVEQNQKLGILKTRFQEATREAEKMQNVVEKVGSAEQIRAVAKLGAGLVGGFTAASGAVRLFGIESEVLEEMTARATTLMSIMGGLNQVAELFGKETLKGLAAVGGGFKTLVTTVRGASVGIKAALVSTGILTLVVAVGALINNFDKIKALFDRTSKQQKQLAEDQLTYAKNFNIIAQEAVKQKQIELDLARQNEEYLNKGVEIKEKELDLATSLLAQNQAEQKELLRIAELKVIEYDKAKKADKQKIQDEKIAALAKRDTLIIEEKLLKARLLQAIQDKIIQNAVVEINRSIKEQQDAQIILTAQVDKQRELYLSEKAIIEERLKILRLEITTRKKLSTEQTEEYKTLVAQLKALELQEKERQRLLKIEIEQIENQRRFENGLIRIAKNYRDLVNDINTQYDALKQNNVELEYTVNNVEKISKQFEELRASREAIVNFDKTGRELNDKQTQALREQLSIYDDIIKDSLGILATELQGIKFSVEKADKAAEELALFRLQQKAKRDLLENDLELLRNRKELLQLNIREINAIGIANENEKRRLDILLEEAKIKLKNAQNDEERRTALLEVQELEIQINNLNQSNADLKQEIIDKDNELLGIDNQILEVNSDIEKTRTDTVEKTKELTDELEKQAKLSAKLNDFVTKYQEEILVGQQALSQSIEFIAALQDRKARKAQDRIDDYQKQLNKLSKEEDERASRLADYEEELKDANGERYDELLSLIEQEKQAQLTADADVENSRAAIEAKIKDEENKKLAAEARAAKWRKAQALVDGVIQGTLAVIKALPNVLLSVATGVLAAAGIATIAAEKTPTIPEGYEEGGFTPKTVSNKTPVGVVHGNEYVAPAFVTKSPQAQPHIAALEAQRLRGYAEGGFVAPDLGGVSQSMIDYDRLINGIISGVKELPNPVVSVVKITQEQREVELTKQGAGMRR